MPNNQTNPVVCDATVRSLHMNLSHFYVEQKHFKNLNDISFYAWTSHEYLKIDDNTVALFIVTPKPKLPAGTPTEDEGQERRGGVK